MKGSSLSEIWDFIILGSGVSGLNLAKILNKKGYSVKIIDSYDVPGGNHITKIIGGMEFDIGSIYFNDADRQFKAFPELHPVCIPYSARLEKISGSGIVSAYPLSLSSDLFSKNYWFIIRTFSSLIAGKMRGKFPTNAAQIIERKIGRFFFVESGLYHYMRRLVGIPAEEISPIFVNKRMRWVMNYSPMRLFFGKICSFFQKKSKSEANQNLFRAPGGFGAFYAIATKALSRDGVSFEYAEDLTSIMRLETVGIFSVKGRRSDYHARRVVSTLPIELTCDLVGIERPCLRNVTLVTLMIAYRGEMKARGDIIFNFHPDACWKRLTIMSRIYGRVEGWEYMSVECPLSESTVIDVEALYDEFSNHLRKLGIFTGELRLMGNHILTHAYPVLSIGYEKEQKRIIEKLDELGIEMAGRQGRFEYVPHSNMAAKLIEDQFGSLPSII